MFIRLLFIWSLHADLSRCGLLCRSLETRLQKAFSKSIGTSRTSVHSDINFLGDPGMVGMENVLTEMS